jgi:hypothetical protein
MDDDKDLDLTDEERRERFQRLLDSLPEPSPDHARFGTFADVSRFLGGDALAAEVYADAGIEHSADITAGQFRSWWKKNETCDDD